MSVRYSIDLVLEPAFTAKVYQTRQIVCGQYSSWAAEMQMLRMALTSYFPCPAEELSELDNKIGEIARETCGHQAFTLARTGIVSDPSMNGITMEFRAPPLLYDLQRDVSEAVMGPSTGASSSEPFLPRINLLEYGSFPGALLPDAVQFAEGVAYALQLAESALPWRLLLTRYSSAAAADDWSNGRWATDLSWQQLASHPLNS